MKQNTTLFVVQAAVIAAMYTALFYLQSIIPGLSALTSYAVQFRICEALNVLALFTPAAIPGLTVGCILSNLLNVGTLPVDYIVGSLATLLAGLCMYALRSVCLKGIPFWSLLMPAIWNGILVGWEIEFFFIDGPFLFGDFLLQGGLVALGEIAVVFVLGLALFFSIRKNAHLSALLTRK